MKVLIVFRGTVNNWENWIYNLRFSQVDPFPDIPNAFIHHGFWIAYKNIHAQLFKALNALPKDKPIRLIGYSKGGAISMIGNFLE